MRLALDDPSAHAIDSNGPIPYALGWPPAVAAAWPKRKAEKPDQRYDEADKADQKAVRKAKRRLDSDFPFLASP